MKKMIVTLSVVLNILLIALLVYVLNTDYEITINNITYKQKIIDYVIGKD